MILYENKTVEYFEKDVTQLLIKAMMSLKIVSSPSMFFLKSSNSLRDAYLQRFASDPAIADMFVGDEERYLLVLAYHALGAGAYIAIKDSEGEDISMTNLPGQKIFEDMCRLGSLELGLKAIHIDVQSNNKKVIDHMMMSSINTIFHEYLRELSSDEKDSYLMALMVLYFNVGVTIAMKRIEAAHNLLDT